MAGSGRVHRRRAHRSGPSPVSSGTRKVEVDRVGRERLVAPSRLLFIYPLRRTHWIACGWGDVGNPKRLVSTKLRVSFRTAPGGGFVTGSKGQPSRLPGHQLPPAVSLRVSFPLMARYRVARSLTTAPHRATSSARYSEPLAGCLREALKISLSDIVLRRRKRTSAAWWWRSQALFQENV